VNKVKVLEHKAKKIYVVFNNNSGGHAAQNAKTYQRLLGIDYEGLALCSNTLTLFTKSCSSDSL
jgi:uncharacterized protein YecE (DUF72 family)